MSTVTFGTSGLRGLVVDFTEQLVQSYAISFASLLKEFSPACRTVALGMDLRPSSPEIARIFSTQLSSLGFEIQFCGELPTPALAFFAAKNSAAAVMITGSHIPADRNGIKFYTPAGEISKADEVFMKTQFAQIMKQGSAPSTVEVLLKNVNTETLANGNLNEVAGRMFIDRYINIFGRQSLTGLRVVFYEHTSVARSIFPQLLEALGAQVFPVGRCADFLPIDTENVSDEEKYTQYIAEHSADLLISTDGDADRPLVVLKGFGFVRGDYLGIMTARFLNSDIAVTPISSTSLVESSGLLKEVRRTKIGSPFVIAEIEESQQKIPQAGVIGFEANGGVLVGSDFTVGPGVLERLKTRDSFLPALVACQLVKTGKVDDYLTKFSARANQSGLLQNFSSELSAKVIHFIESNSTTVFTEIFVGNSALVADINKLDGFRVRFESGDVVHLRQSGNAPELRVYIESDSDKNALDLLNRVKEKLVEIAKLN